MTAVALEILFLLLMAGMALFKLSGCHSTYYQRFIANCLAIVMTDFAKIGMRDHEKRWVLYGVANYLRYHGLYQQLLFEGGRAVRAPGDTLPVKPLKRRSI